MTRKRASQTLREIIRAQTPNEPRGVAKPIGDMSHEEMRAAGIRLKVIPAIEPSPITVRPMRFAYRGTGSQG